MISSDLESVECDSCRDSTVRHARFALMDTVVYHLFLVEELRCF